MSIWALAAFIVLFIWGALGWYCLLRLDEKRERERAYYYQTLGEALVKDWDPAHES